MKPPVKKTVKTVGDGLAPLRGYAVHRECGQDAEQAAHFLAVPLEKRTGAELPVQAMQFARIADTGAGARRASSAHATGACAFADRVGKTQDENRRCRSRTRTWVSPRKTAYVAVTRDRSGRIVRHTGDAGRYPAKRLATLRKKSRTDTLSGGRRPGVDCATRRVLAGISVCSTGRISINLLSIYRAIAGSSNMAKKLAMA